jgi:hypothetical protein
MKIGSGDFDAAGQPRLLIGGNVGLVTMHRFAPTMTSPARLIVTL